MHWFFKGSWALLCDTELCLHFALTRMLCEAHLRSSVDICKSVCFPDLMHICCSLLTVEMFPPSKHMQQFCPRSHKRTHMCMRTSGITSLGAYVRGRTHTHPRPHLHSHTRTCTGTRTHLLVCLGCVVWAVDEVRGWYPTSEPNVVSGITDELANCTANGKGTCTSPCRNGPGQVVAVCTALGAWRVADTCTAVLQYNGAAGP